MPVCDLLTKSKMAVFPHPPSPDLAPCDLLLLPELNTGLKGRGGSDITVFQAEMWKILSKFQTANFTNFSNMVYSLGSLHKVPKKLLCRRQHWLEGKWCFCCREIHSVQKVCDNTSYTFWRCLSTTFRKILHIKITENLFLCDLTSLIRLVQRTY